jgi:hypothetical protein
VVCRTHLTSCLAYCASNSRKFACEASGAGRSSSCRVRAGDAVNTGGSGSTRVLASYARKTLLFTVVAGISARCTCCAISRQAAVPTVGPIQREVSWTTHTTRSSPTPICLVICHGIDRTWITLSFHRLECVAISATRPNLIQTHGADRGSSLRLQAFCAVGASS